MRLRPVAAAVLVAIAACSHSDPYVIDPPVSGGPFDPGPPVRLTYNARQDLTPSWRTSGPGFVYAFESGETDRDICLGVLREGGGARILEKCVLNDPEQASRDALLEPAESPAGRLAWFETSHPVQLYAPLRSVIRVGTYARADTGRAVLELPYFAPSQRPHATVSHLGWLGPDTLVFVAADLSYSQPPGCPFCPIDSLVVNPEIVLLDLTQAPAFETDLPNTLGATSVWPAADRTSVFYTLADDSLVYQQTPAGAVTVVHNFGAGRVARDVQVVGGRLWAVVEGQVLGLVDRGGLLTVVELSNGQETLVAGNTRFFRRPAVAGTGSRVVAQGYDVTVAGTDTTVGTVADLWQVDQ